MIMLTTNTVSIRAGNGHAYFTVANGALVLGVNHWFGFSNSNRDRDGNRDRDRDTGIGSERVKRPDRRNHPTPTGMWDSYRNST